MKFNNEQNAFIDNYVKALRENNAVVFAGAGMSLANGFFDWKQLLSPITKRLGLDIDKEHDLTAVAQYFVDMQGGNRGELSQILYEEYGKIKLEVTPVHRILARLPIQTYWTTNYDRTIENALTDNGKTPDIKKSDADLAVNLPRRDAIIYKMHGDIGNVSETVLTKHEYEDYSKKWELFSNAFRSDFVSKTFVFIGFSFTDPNLEYLIGRIRSTIGRNKKPDYFFIKRSQDHNEQHRQEIRFNSLKPYGLNAIWINDYSEIKTILEQVETRFLRSAVLISGSAETYHPHTKHDSEEFLHELSRTLSAQGYKIVSGFGLGVGSAVINGVLENMQNQHNQNLDQYIVLRPFPQIVPASKDIQAVWADYRRRFIPLAGIAIFVFGNKAGGVLADGVQKEFDIAVERGLKVVPIGVTGSISRVLWEEVVSHLDNYYPDQPEVHSLLQSLGDLATPLRHHIPIIVKIINLLNTY
jgi:hypothetical protein